MRTPYAVTFMLVILLGGTYMYTQVQAVCQVPVSYRIGQMDEEFDITEEEARVAIADAESVWEQATGRNLFTYDPEGTLAINFIFDDRQAFAKAEIDFREHLDSVKNQNSEISETYADLISRYNDLEIRYDDKVAAYERRLARYNAEVEAYNEDGGAPPEVFAELEAEKEELNDEVADINALGERINQLAAEINHLGETGNELVEDYNQNVDQYNDTFGESREFTQGDYQGDRINIYKFVDGEELRLVLAHEFGHALSLGHVENEASVLYDHLGGQPEDLRLSEQDLTEFERVCGQSTRSRIERLFILFGI